MSTQPQSRIDAGVPTGGQFATTGRLDAGSDVLDDNDIDTAVDMPDVADLAAALADVQRWSRKSANHWGTRRRVSIEDLEQEVMLQFLQTLAAKRKADGGSLSGRNAAQILNPAYVHATARRVAANMAAGGTPSVEQAAMRVFRGRREEFSTLNGREMTSKETEKLATEVRDSFPAGERPAVGFHIGRGVYSLGSGDQSNTGDDNSWVLRAAESAKARGNAHVDNTEFAAGSFGDQAMAASEIGGKRGQAAMEDLAWNSVAERMGAPIATQGTLLNDREVATTRADIKALTEALPKPDGREATVLDAVHAWENGDLDDSAMEPVFRAFGGDKLSADECDRVGRVLKLAGHQRSNQLLDLAVRAAKTPRPKKVTSNA